MTDDALPAELIELFAALPRQGPGSAAQTRAVLADALRLAPGLAPTRIPTRIIDAGCGTGASTRVLAEALMGVSPEVSIVAVDLLEPLLARVRAWVEEGGWTERIEARCASMLELEEPPASVDLIWSEGAIYAVGVVAALTAWAPLLRPGARVVFSEACWWLPVEQRPAALVEWWAREYPDLGDEAEVLTRIEEAGFRCVTTRRLEPEAWWTDYYDPLARRCEQLQADASPSLAAAIELLEREIACARANQGVYGYTFFIVEPDRPRRSEED